MPPSRPPRSTGRAARDPSGVPSISGARLAAPILLALALVGAIAAYAPGLDSPYVFDDERYVRDNPSLLHAWPPGWLRAGTQETRPVTNLSFALDAALLGPTVRAHHLVNLALHLVSALLLFFVARRVHSALAPRAPNPDLFAALAAALLALHPVQSGTVLYVQGRPGLLATVFALAAVWLAASTLETWRATRHRALRAVGVATLVALSALAKESGAVVPALVLLLDLVRSRRTRDAAGLRDRLARLHVPAWIGLLPVALAYVVLRNPHGGVFGAGTVDAVRFFATQPYALLTYLRLSLWPAGLAIDRLLPLLSPADPRAWGAALALLALLALVVRSAWRGGWPGFWGAWWLLALAPTTMLPGREFFAERYLALATPAWAALAAGALAWLAERIGHAGRGAARATEPARATARTTAPERATAPALAPERATAEALAPERPAAPAMAPERATARAPALSRATGSAPVLIALAILTLVPLGIASRARARVWASDLALWREATRVSPENPRAWYQVGRLLFAADSVPQAEDAVRRALALGGPDPQRYALLSGIAATTGRLDSSVVFAARAAATAPQKAWTHVALARALARVGRWRTAQAAAEAALAIEPDLRPALYLRGRARLGLGDLEGARADGARLGRLGGAEVQAAALAGAVSAATGDAERARRSLALAIERTPRGQDEALACLDALRDRAPLLLAAGDPAGAAAGWSLYLEATGAALWDTTALAGLARAERASGRTREAELTARGLEQARARMASQVEDVTSPASPRPPRFPR